MKRTQLIEMGANPISETEFCGYLSLDHDGTRDIYEPSDAKNLDNCDYYMRNRFPLSRIE